MTTKEEQNELFKELTEGYLIRSETSQYETVQFVDVETNKDLFGDQLSLHQENCSYTFDEIFLGIHEDLDKRAMSFFNGLGYIHCLYNNKFPNHEDIPYKAYAQALSWRTGIILAKKNGMEFETETINWAISQFKGGFRDNSNEQTPTKFFEEAKNFAFTQPLREQKLKDLL